MRARASPIGSPTSVDADYFNPASQTMAASAWTSPCPPRHRGCTKLDYAVLFALEAVRHRAPHAGGNGGCSHRGRNHPHHHVC